MSSADILAFDETKTDTNRTNSYPFVNRGRMVAAKNREVSVFRHKDQLV